MARVSVVIPVYNIEQHLRQCLDSVAAQTLRDLEVICVDDGSDDGSPQILREYTLRDSRFRTITQINAGPGAARNVGLDAATGDFLIFLDADDWFELDFLNQMTERALFTGADVVICQSEEFDTDTNQVFSGEWMLKKRYLPKGVFSPQEVAEHIFQMTYGMPWDKLFRTEQVRRAGIRFPSLYNSEDLAFVFPALLSVEQIAVLPRTLVHHRVNRSDSVSNSRSHEPQAPYEAFLLVKSFLEERGLMEQYQRSFLNWAMEFLVWHVSNMDDPAIRQEYFQVLRHKWLPELKFEKHPPSYYEDTFSYIKYLMAKYMPYSVFSGILTVYKTCRGRHR